MSRPRPLSHRDSVMALTQDDTPIGDRVDDGRSPLDMTIDKIGMGYYQWALLGLCGFGWLADNMWLQAIAISLPRIQDHFNVPDSQIGWLSTSSFAGMLIGAVGWGACSDHFGRSVAFNATLVLTTIFGFLASLAPTYPLLCLSLFLLGTAVGGSMPTDGTLFLENIPKSKRYLLTGLSVFFSVGSVVAAFVALIVVPPNSCPEVEAKAFAPLCDVATQNLGWKYLFFILASITAAMFICRLFLFRLYESPRFLVHSGRPQEAVHVLQQISKTNGLAVSLDLNDVEDTIPGGGALSGRYPSSGPHSPPHGANSPPQDYSSTSTSNFAPPGRTSRDEDEAEETEAGLKSGPRPLSRRRSSRTLSRRLSGYISLSKKLAGPLEKVGELFDPEWRKATILTWGAWFCMALAYTMFNVYFPKLIELRLGDEAPGQVSRVRAMWDVVVFTLGGMPGAILGSYMIEKTNLGRRKSLAISTAVTGLLCLLFTSPSIGYGAGLVTTSMGISLASTTMWSILYGMTPQMFITRVRGTACGAASGFSRIGGMIAPVLGGGLLSLNPSWPVWTSAATFFVAAVCAIALPFESASDVETDDEAGEYTLLH